MLRCKNYFSIKIVNRKYFLEFIFTSRRCENVRFGDGERAKRKFREPFQGWLRMDSGRGFEA
jgi:hypothetical protein